ncbi:zinc ribbon domain-containing protein [uncultured Methanobrevibacter sp.]|uniref:zinc ribbon domain-containing protein n=1 Tax=uncultured Methanobrevibacter sp. TaxID=253161 RepID=UPI002611D3B1|nr:zinc ribbon domain-containing protein [uncultured Methanobrevibacter sp.]
MKCPNCQSENSETAKFCKKCGAALEKNTISHESMINSMSGNKPKSSNDTTKIIIIALAIVAVVLAGAFIYLYASGNSSSDSNSASADDSSSQVESTPTQASQPTQASKPASTSMSILGGSFSTGSAESDKTYAQIYVGTQNAGKSVIVQIFYSRDGNALNNGNMVPASVHSDGYLYITSADAYHYYPDYATINLYDSNSNLMDTQSVSLTPTSGTQYF